jgi:Tol biopolymer transport system component/predicted Ser/Thr protein kinase
MVGRQLGQYRIVEEIGKGGMGVVYLAEDVRLGRRVALKVLPAEVAADPARRARFEREARAIAALNHPNIVTLHSVEEVDGVTFLTMELVDGNRLGRLLDRNGLPLDKLLDWSLGIAAALAAAHRQGVVHRDLKPDNIMITGDGRIKVLDFGLAKLRESAQDEETVVPTASITEAGKILGTVSYMSPEQAEGKPLDHRSDIFSFGVVFYEMATGRRPFVGETAVSTISSILRDTPPPPQQLNAALPAQLGRIVRRCLAKEPDRRYQSTDDLRNELLELKEDSDSGELARQAAVPVQATATRSSRRMGRGLLGLLVLGVTLVVLLAVADRVWLRPHGQTGAAPAALAPIGIQMSRATTDGNVTEAAISPDGRYVAYVRRDRTVFSLRLRQLATGDEVQLVMPTDDFMGSPSFSADGDFLHYVSIEHGDTVGSVYRVSLLGGTPRRIVDGASFVSAAPDGRRIAIMSGSFAEAHVRVVGIDGDAPRDVATREQPDHFDTPAVWSSDGRSLAIVSHRFGEPHQVVLIDPESGAERPRPLPALRSIGSLSFTPGGNSLLVAGSERPVNQEASSQIWEASEAGDLQPLTRDLNSYSGLSVTSDGSIIAAVQQEQRSGIEVATVRDGAPGEFVELFPTSVALAGFDGIAWLADGKLAYSMKQGEVQQVFVTDVATRSTRALTAGTSHHGPSASRDGRVLVTIRDDGDRSNVWRVDPETGREQRLTDGKFDALSIVTWDGASVVYSSVRDETAGLFKIATEGGTPVALYDGPMWCFDTSEADQDALCVLVGESGEPDWILMPLAGGDPRPVTGIPKTARTAKFAPDRRTITYLATTEGVDEIWTLPPEGGQPRRLVRIEGKEILNYAWSPDGSRLAIVKWAQSGDVVLLRRT